MYMQKILDNVKVDKCLAQLNEHPEVWDCFNMRTTMFQGSPHRDVHDVWLRYRDFSEFDPNNPLLFAGRHESIWYRAADVLSYAKKLIMTIQVVCGIDEIGGCLITKIPAGKEVFRHNDSGAWHSEYYKDKYLLLLQSAPGQRFCFDGEEHEGESGDLFIFNNLTDHWVTNDSDVDRISLIIAGRKNT